MLFLDELGQEKDIEEVSLRLAEVLYAKFQNLVRKIDLVNRRWVFYSRAYGNFAMHCFDVRLVKIQKKTISMMVVVYR